MSKNLLITGGSLRPNGFELGEGKYYEAAQLLRLDCESSSLEELLKVSEGNENFPDEYPNLEFTVGCVEGKELWLAMDTEIRLYDYPSLNLKRTISHPCFHNVHSVAVRGEQLYVTSTGLDTVVILDKASGEIIELINTEGKATWHRFSPDLDYRKLHSTRPHHAHPNFVFWLDNQPWVTRCNQEDAVCLRDFSRRIDISGPDKVISVHDGVTAAGKVYFTSVDGCVAIADQNSYEVETLELSQLEGYGGIRGWCRGLHIEDDILYIGFSRLRKTNSLQKIKWVNKLLGVLEIHKSASVLAIDIKQRRIVGDYTIPDVDAIYSILPEPG